MTVPPVGSKVYLRNQARPFKVRACDHRYAVCTRPHFHTVMYFVLDVIAEVRGTENLIFCMGAESDQDCAEMLQRIASGESEISYRNRVDLDIDRVVFSD